jgi:hypothetical protein
VSPRWAVFDTAADLVAAPDDATRHRLAAAWSKAHEAATLPRTPARTPTEARALLATITARLG